jgi:hypothetical protein
VTRIYRLEPDPSRTTLRVVEDGRRCEECGATPASKIGGHPWLCSPCFHGALNRCTREILEHANAEVQRADTSLEYAIATLRMYARMRPGHRVEGAEIEAARAALRGLGRTW